MRSYSYEFRDFTFLSSLKVTREWAQPVRAERREQGSKQVRRDDCSMLDERQLQIAQSQKTLNNSTRLDLYSKMLRWRPLDHQRAVAVQAREQVAVHPKSKNGPNDSARDHKIQRNLHIVTKVNNKVSCTFKDQHDFPTV